MLRVVCLCAEWCSACRAWRPVWDAVAARHAQIHWQSMDIETFPTVLIARGDRALFLSAIPPQPEFLENLIARLGREDAAPQGVTPEAAALAARLFARG